MNFKELLAPYSENGRTIEGQIHWLISKGFNKEIIKDALCKVYFEIDHGMTFKDGHDLDRYLILMANSLREDKSTLLANEAENAFKKFAEKENKLNEQREHKSLKERIILKILRWE